MNTHTLTTSYKTEGGSVAVKTETITGDLSINIERKNLTAGATGVQFVVGSIAPANIKGIAIGITKSTGQSASANAEATVKTNSASTPDNTFTGLAPAKGVAWTVLDAVNVNPITATLTSFFVDVTGSANIDLAIRILVDSTPGLEG